MGAPCGCNEVNQDPCGQITPCVETNCACDVFLDSKCITNISVDTPCVDIPKGLPMNEWIPLAFTRLCTKIADIASNFTLKNVGVGVGKLYKGISILGEKEIKSIKAGTLVNVTNLTEEVEVKVDTEALTTFVNNLIPPSGTDTASNVGIGLGLSFRDKIAGVFNFRKIKTDNSGVSGESILKTEATVGDDIVITAKKIATDGTLIIGSDADKISLGIPDASLTVEGRVNIIAQNFKGNKVFLGNTSNTSSGISPAYNLVVGNPSQPNSFVVHDSGTIGIANPSFSFTEKLLVGGNTTIDGRLRVQGTVSSPNSSVALTANSSINNLDRGVLEASNIGVSIRNNGIASNSINMDFSTGGVTIGGLLGATSGMNTMASFEVKNNVASGILPRGSIPFPKMTQTERLSITSLTTGLHVYQTDGGLSEGVWVYKSGGWVQVY